MRLRVTPQMTARFFDCEIHPLYATFAIVEHAEYASRCAILSFLEATEDAVGSAVEITHTAPARVGEVVTIQATVTEVAARKIICEVQVWNSEGEIARGSTTQHLVLKAKLKERIAGKD